jgi:hypothetical protein
VRLVNLLSPCVATSAPRQRLNRRNSHNRSARGGRIEPRADCVSKGGRNGVSIVNRGPYVTRKSVGFAKLAEMKLVAAAQHAVARLGTHR